MTFSCASSAKSTVLKIVRDEKFEEIYRPNEDGIRIVNDGRTCEKVKLWSFGCALGNHSYSSGIHRIRIFKQHGIVFLGIRSRSIPPVPDLLAFGRYDASPSTYGWWTTGARMRNGRHESIELKDDDKSSSVFTLILNCDERRLGIISEDSHEQDEMEVYNIHAPFPWCLFGQLSRAGGRVSLL